MQYTPAQHVKKNTLKKEGFVLYQVFLILVYMVMAGESFGYVVTRQATTKQFLDEKMLFLDPSTSTILAVIFPAMGSLFIIISILMVRRLNADWSAVGQRKVCRHRDLITPIRKATAALSISMIMMGIRYFFELVSHDWLAGACDDLLYDADGGNSHEFIFYWFMSICLTSYLGYGAIIYSIYLRKHHEWEKLLRMPLKLPKSTTTTDMANMLGALKDEIEEHRFKEHLVDDSELTYKKKLIEGFEDNFTYT